MKKQGIVCCLFALLLSFIPGSYLHAASLESKAKSADQTCFSPDGGCAELVLKTIGQARSEILIMAYSFRTMPIAEALVKAHQKGIKVELVMDKSERQEGFTPAHVLHNAGISVWLDGTHAVMNNRLMIIDGKTVLTGSYSFTAASENMNAENMIIIHSPELAKRYKDNWLIHRNHSEKY